MASLAVCKRKKQEWQQKEALKGETVVRGA